VPDHPITHFFFILNREITICQVGAKEKLGDSNGIHAFMVFLLGSFADRTAEYFAISTHLAL